MKPIDMRPLMEVRSGWISISRDYKKVIAEARTLKGLLAKLKKMGNPDGVITNVAKDYSNYIGIMRHEEPSATSR
jgi:hypothetical protein